MAWNKEAVKEVPVQSTNKEVNWTSDYTDSLDRWVKDFELAGYKLTAEYDLGEGETLYRFEGPGVPHNVLIKTKR